MFIINTTNHNIINKNGEVIGKFEKGKIIDIKKNKKMVETGLKPGHLSRRPCLPISPVHLFLSLFN